MIEKTETIDREKEPGRGPTRTYAKEFAKEALRRLAELRETLPPVDAVSLVREGRDLANRDLS